ncbi:MAG TPA: ribonuclease HI [Fluviicola sp.]|nr:ribonuclease HI [Fluviicola sp.]
MEAIHIFTDGSSRGNPGPGGYGIVLKYKSFYKELAKGFRLTTNNRMELLAVIDALKVLKNKSLPIIIYSDSKYVIDAIEKKWVIAWKQKNFAKKKNKDLWLEYLALSKDLNLTFQWVKGHAGHPENERCDYLAVQAALGNELFIDQYFEEVQQHEND